MDFFFLKRSAGLRGAWRPVKPGSGVGVTWHQWFPFREDQARCWEPWGGLGPRARPGPVEESRERLSGRLWGQPHPWRRKSLRGRRGRPGGRAAERTRSTEGWDREMEGSARSHQADECARLPAARGPLAQRCRRRLGAAESSWGKGGRGACDPRKPGPH